MTQQTRSLLAQPGKCKAAEVFGDRPRLEEKKVFMPDTCYLRKLVDSGYGIYESLKRLSAHGDVVITIQVMKELERQVKFERPREEAAQILGEFHRAFGEGVAMLERVSISDGERKALSEKMAQASEKGNRRVGEGEASIFSIAGVLAGLYGAVHVLSDDSDVRVLRSALGFAWMEVSGHYAP